MKINMLSAAHEKSTSSVRYKASAIDRRIMYKFYDLVLI